MVNYGSHFVSRWIPECHICKNTFFYQVSPKVMIDDKWLYRGHFGEDIFREELLGFSSKGNPSVCFWFDICPPAHFRCLSLYGPWTALPFAT